MRTYKIAMLVFGIVTTVAFLAIPAGPLVAQDGASGAEVVQAFAEALSAGDVDLAMTYIADDAIFGGELGGVSYSMGAEQIRADFEELAAVNFRIETDVVATYAEDQVIVTDTRTWNDVTIEMGVAPLEFTEVYLVKDGKIFGINYATPAATEERFLTAMAAMEPPPVTAEDIIGTWRWFGGGFHFQFRPDGTFRASQTVTDLNSDTPEDIGTYSVEDGVLTMTSGEITRYCHEGDIGIYALSFRDNGELELLLQSDECGPREAPSSLPQPFTRIEDGQ